MDNQKITTYQLSLQTIVWVIYVCVSMIILIFKVLQTRTVISILSYIQKMCAQKQNKVRVNSNIRITKTILDTHICIS